MPRRSTCISQQQQQQPTATHQAFKVSNRHKQRFIKLRQLAENLSQKQVDDEVGEQIRDSEVDGDGRIDLRGVRQDASARILAAKELVEAFVKNNS